MRIATVADLLTINYQAHALAVRRLGASMADATHAFKAFGAACARLKQDEGYQRSRVAMLRRALGWRRFFSDGWYQAVYDLHQLTRERTR